MDALFSDYEDVQRSGLFDAEYYLATYPDVAQRNIDPLVHFLEDGAREGRDPNPDFDAAFYLEQCRARGEQPENPLLHYVRIGAARGFKTRRDAADRAVPARQPPGIGESAVRMPVLVAIEALGVTGGPDGTSRLSVSGWALAAAPIVEITVSLDGEVRGSAAYGLARPDVAKLYPDRAAAANSGFILACELPRGRSGAIEPALGVRTADGELGRHALRVEIPPQQIGAAVVEPHAGMPIGVRGTGKLPMQLDIDRAVVDPGGVLQLEGWVVCLVQIEAVEAFVDDLRIGQAEFGRARADIAKSHPDYPNSQFAGFRLVADLGISGAGGKTITLRANARAGISATAAVRVEFPEIAAAGRAQSLTGFQHHCDEVVLSHSGHIALTGWFVCPSPTEAVCVLLDGEEIGRAEIGLERPEIGNLFPAVPHARQPGFAFAARLRTLGAGPHRLALLVYRADGQTHELSLPAAPAADGASGTATFFDADRVLHIDDPEIVDGTAELPVRGNLPIGGWGLARAGVAAIEIAIDGTPIALAEHGLRRPDIQAAFPDWPDSHAGGFRALIPHRVLPHGRRTISVTLRGKDGRTASAEFRIEVEELSDAIGPWSLRRTMPQAEIDLDRRILEHCGCRPVFVAILPIDGEGALERAGITIASLNAQAYPHWRLLILPQGPGLKPAPFRRRLLAEPWAADERVAVVGQLNRDTVTAFAMKAGAAADEMFFTVLAAGDELGADAFLEMAIAAAMHRDGDFLYSDERRRNPASGLVEAFFKPQWSPDLMLSTNYVGRLWCARADLLGRLAAADALIGHGEYDLVLRATEAAVAIRHLAAVLCERADDGIESPAQTTRALERALVRRGIAGEVVAGLAPGAHRIKRALVEPGLVSIIIATCAARGLVERCITTLRALTAYRDYEIICIENIPPEDSGWRDWLGRNADRVIATTEPFNWSSFNNLGAAEALGRYLLFLNDDVEIIDPDWLDALLQEAQRPEVGVVGARLLYPDRRVQHAGMFLAMPGQARHAFRDLAEEAPGYFGLSLTQRNVIAVTGACLLTRRATFDALGGFDEAHRVVNNDLDYCLRAWRSGLLTVYTPHARLIHHEAVSRAALDDEYDVASFDAAWRGLFLAGDPYFNPHLAKTQDGMAIDLEPTRLLVTGRPLLQRDDLRRILVVKLDHIGDCIIAFPAVRRLKQHFPDASISVLTSRASQAVWALEPSVDETIEFDFFHARSAEGELERSEADWQNLRQRLAVERFDLAVDLRKHTETRPVLQYTGARVLAGFDFRDQFPWLDIALEWTGDPAYVRKRQHNGDDLINLVDAIAASCEDDRRVIAAPPPNGAAPALAMPAIKAGAGPLVCVHPTVGNDARQWPVEYFVAVIDRLVETDGARVVLIGGPGDEEVASDILGRVRRPASVTSLVGKLPLAALPAWLAGVSLFLGNNSGPKHIAAGIGVPTVGVHSGTEDVREWGPVGPSAIAVARDVVCAPCYLATAAECRRGLACLRELEPARVYEACKRLLLLSTVAPPVEQAAVGATPISKRRAAPGNARRRAR
ncbi:MAG TPA: glycosyltransferase family 9 protein [Stellaceae bacterium]|nr:glycosyltransferase family 9 protein [Stellaceae bacterium]